MRASVVSANTLRIASQKPMYVAGHRSEEHTSELQSQSNLVCRLLLDPSPPDTYTLSLHDALPIYTHVGQEAHFNLAHALAFARVATTARRVEREPRWRVTTHARFGRFGEHLANRIPETDVRRRAQIGRAHV